MATQGQRVSISDFQIQGSNPTAQQVCTSARRVGIAGLFAALAVLTLPSAAREFHVSIQGDDVNPGTRRAPLRTIQRAAELAQPGDVVTVHEGVYRERVNPARGGASDRKRIVYRAAPGERVEIKGSEVVKGWTRVQDDVWRVTLPNAFFGNFNPFTNVISGDWFDPRGRLHHTAAVYLDGEWLSEAVRLEQLLDPTAAPVAAAGDYLLNVAWWRPFTGETETTRIPAVSFVSQRGIQTAPCSEGGGCIGWIEHGDWVRYEGVDFGARSDRIEFRAASATAGGVIEVRLDSPGGELLARVTVRHTGDWQRWATFGGRLKPVSGIKTVCLVFRSPQPVPVSGPLWFAQVDKSNTTIWAQFPGVNPNEQLVEVNARPAVFYPDQPGRNFITVRGFILRHAATQWAPPTAEQIGLIGTHWSKGWIIESNVISHSICVGISLGKHGDEFDNTSANTAEGYVKTIERAHAFRIPWTREHIGHHAVRYNHISHCEQAGIVGSLGCAFSLIEGNEIHDIHVRRLFGGAEMAGIKFHGAIDTIIRSNHVYRTCRGLWLDWMAQGTRVSGNLFHDNTPGEDLFVEVNHGPFLVDNNLFLSPNNVLDMSEGGAYAHNLFAGKITNRPEPGRQTPFHPAHSTKVAGLAITTGGDNRFFNNLFIGTGQIPTAAERSDLKELRWISSHGLWGYDGREFPIFAAGNVHLHGAQPSAQETDALVQPDVNPAPRLVEENGRWFLHLTVRDWAHQAGTTLVTTERLGRARVAGARYENPDGSPVRLNRDYFGRQRDPKRPTPGPLELRARERELRLRVW